MNKKVIKKNTRIAPMNWEKEKIEDEKGEREELNEKWLCNWRKKWSSLLFDTQQRCCYGNRTTREK